MPRLKRKRSATDSGETPGWNKRKVVVEDEESFHHTLAQDVSFASENRSLEQFLYIVFNHISSTICKTVQTHKHPNSTISTAPQYAFGNPGAKNPPTFEPVEGLKLRILSMITDSARIIKVNKSGRSKETIHILVDFTEIKPLNVDAEWHTQEAKDEAFSHVTRYILQVFKTAMAAFLHHSDWHRVYAMLVVGVYYSQFLWKRPSKGLIRPPIEFDCLKSFPTTRQTAEEFERLVEHLDAAIDECNGRLLPEVLCFNEPMLTYHQVEDSSASSEITLTPQFLYSMRLPLKRWSKTKYQFSWLSAPSEKPDFDLNAIKEGRQIVHSALVLQPGKKLKRFRNTLLGPPTVSRSTVDNGHGRKRPEDPDLAMTSYLKKKLAIEAKLTPLKERIVDWHMRSKAKRRLRKHQNPGAVTADLIAEASGEVLTRRELRRRGGRIGVEIAPMGHLGSRNDANAND